MKKKILILFFICVNCFFCCAKNNSTIPDFDFDLYFQYPNVKKTIYLGCGSIKDNLLSISTDKAYYWIKEYKLENNKNSIQISFLESYFFLNGSPSYRQYEIAKLYSFFINNNEITFMSTNSKDNNQNKIVIESMNYVLFSSPALIICDNLRIRESPNTNTDTKVIGKLQKWDKVTVTECTEQKDKIDNLEYPWYKIRTEEGTEGWIFGGFAKIYFTEDDLELLYKAFEKEGSEYTNQFPTLDNS